MNNSKKLIILLLAKKYNQVHTKLEMIILSESFDASSRMFVLGPLGVDAGRAEAFCWLDFFLEAVEAEEEEDGLETPRPEERLLVPRDLGLDEMISSRDLSRLEDIVNIWIG